MVSIDKVTIAARELDAMVVFYSAVLGTRFQPVEMFGRTLFQGSSGGLDFLVCPADLAGVDATNNTVQLRFVTADVDAAYQLALGRGGTALAEPVTEAGRRLAAVRDPDGNSLELVAPAG